MGHCKETKKVHSVEHVLTLLVNDEKIKGSNRRGQCLQQFNYNNYWKIKHSTNIERRCYLNSKRFISWKLFQPKNNPNLWSWDKEYNKLFKTKKSSVYDNITGKILRACASLISHQLSYIIITHYIQVTFLTVLK